MESKIKKQPKEKNYLIANPITKKGYKRKKGFTFGSSKEARNQALKDITEYNKENGHYTNDKCAVGGGDIVRNPKSFKNRLPILEIIKF